VFSEEAAMLERERVVASLLVVAGGEWWGIDKFQFATYLMDRLGFGSGFQFWDEHGFGPFSRDLSNAIGDAKAFGVIDEYRDDSMGRYRFRLKSIPILHDYGTLGTRRACYMMRVFKDAHPTVLSLAAGIDWIWSRERIADWEAEIVKRRPVRTQNGRLQEVVDLLSSVDLSPRVEEVA